MWARATPAQKEPQLVQSQELSRVPPKRVLCDQGGNGDCLQFPSLCPWSMQRHSRCGDNRPRLSSRAKLRSALPGVQIRARQMTVSRPCP
jgi:hypothetical protein